MNRNQYFLFLKNFFLFFFSIPLIQTTYNRRNIIPNRKKADCLRGKKKKNQKAKYHKIFLKNSLFFCLILATQSLLQQTTAKIKICLFFSHHNHYQKIAMALWAFFFLLVYRSNTVYNICLLLKKYVSNQRDK